MSIIIDIVTKYLELKQDKRCAACDKKITPKDKEMRLLATKERNLYLVHNDCFDLMHWILIDDEEH